MLQTNAIGQVPARGMMNTSHPDSGMPALWKWVLSDMLCFVSDCNSIFFHLHTLQSHFKPVPCFCCAMQVPLPFTTVLCCFSSGLSCLARCPFNFSMEARSQKHIEAISQCVMTGILWRWFCSAWKTLCSHHEKFKSNLLMSSQ